MPRVDNLRNATCVRRPACGRVQSCVRPVSDLGRVRFRVLPEGGGFLYAVTGSTGGRWAAGPLSLRSNAWPVFRAYPEIWIRAAW